MAAEVVMGRADMRDLTALGMPKIDAEEVRAVFHTAHELRRGPILGGVEG